MPPCDHQHRRLAWARDALGNPATVPRTQRDLPRRFPLLSSPGQRRPLAARTGGRDLCPASVRAPARGACEVAPRVSPTGQLAEPSSRLRRNVQLVVRAEKTPRRGAAGPWHARMRSAERKLSLHFGRRLRGERWAGESLDGRFASACLCRGVSRGIWSKSKLRRSSSRLQSSLQGRFTRVSSAGRDAIAT
mgnify:CR=1 FL=1